MQDAEKQKVPYIYEGGRWANPALAILRERGYELGLVEELARPDADVSEDDIPLWFARKEEELWVCDDPWPILGLLELKSAFGRLAWEPGDPDPVTPVLEQALGDLSGVKCGRRWLEGLQTRPVESPGYPVTFLVHTSDSEVRKRQVVYENPAFRLLETRGYQISPYVLTSETDEPPEPDENGEIRGWVAFWLAERDDVSLGGISLLTLLGLAICWERWKRLPGPDEAEDIWDEIKTRAWGE